MPIWLLFSTGRTAARILIARSIEEFNKHTCVQWVPRTQEKNYVAFENGAGYV